jgi:hypothetical protein
MNKNRTYLWNVVVATHSLLVGARSIITLSLIIRSGQRRVPSSE